MTNRERPYTTNPSVIFENVVFGNFSNQPGRHARDVWPDGVVHLPGSDVFSELRARYPDIAKRFPHDDEAQDHPVAQSEGLTVWTGEDQVAPVIPLLGVERNFDWPPDDAS